MSTVPARPLTSLERTVLERILTVDFDGAEAFRKQVPGLRVIAKCDCGCPTVMFQTESNAHERLLGAEGRYAPTEPDGPPGEVIIFARNGELSSVEYVYYDNRPPAEFPDPDLLDVIATPMS